MEMVGQVAGSGAATVEVGFGGVYAGQELVGELDGH